MEQFEHDDELARLLGEIAETCGATSDQQQHTRSQHTGAVPSGAEETPDMLEPEDVVLSPEDQAAMELDEEYFEQRIAKVHHNEDGSAELRLIETDKEDDGTGNIWTIPAGQCVPTEGEIARFYGDSPFGDIRGLSIAGRTHFYTPKAAADVQDAVARFEFEQQMREQAADFDLRAEALPWPLRKQYLGFRREHPEGMMPMSGVIDDFENAARIARHFRTEEAIRAFYGLPDEEYRRVSTEIGLASPGDHPHQQCSQALACIKQIGWDLEL